jgi:hypothetical protein
MVTLGDGLAATTAGAGSTGRSLARGSSAVGSRVSDRGALAGTAGAAAAVSVATSSALRRLVVPRRAAMANVRVGDMDEIRKALADER